MTTRTLSLEEAFDEELPLERLKFGSGNAKLDQSIITFALPSGDTCPGAKDCKAWVREVTVAGYKTRRLTDGKDQEYRCHSASLEAAFQPTYLLTRHNMRLLLAARKRDPAWGIFRLLRRDVPPLAKFVRVHTHGDFFSQTYFDAWLNLAKIRPGMTFYGYTKSLPLWVKRLPQMPWNFVLTASYGGKYDHMIPEFDLRSATVVDHPSTAEALGLEIDHDDSHARSPGPSFALLLHGMGKAGSFHNEATKRMRDEGVHYSYPFKS